MSDELVSKYNLSSGTGLELIRENGKINELDIAVYTKGRIKIGYILEKDLPVLALLMDAGKAVVDTVTKREEEVICYRINDSGVEHKNKLRW